MNDAQLQELNSILAACLAIDNEVRKQAEQVVNAHLKRSPDQFVFGFLHVLRVSEFPHVRSLCAILLRRKLPEGKPLLLDQLNPQLQSVLKTQLLECLVRDADRHVRGQVAETIAAVAEVLMRKNGWPDLLPFLLKSMTANDQNLRVLGLQIVGTISADCPEALDPHAVALSALYADALNDANPAVRLGAAGAACQTFTAVDPQHNKKYQALIPRVCEILSSVVRSEDTEDVALKLLGALADAMQDNATFFRPHIVNMSQLLGSIGASQDVADGVRQVCVETLVIACEVAPGMVRKLPNFLQHAVQAALALMLSFEEDPNWSNHRTLDSDIIDNSNFGCGEMAIDRLSGAIQGQKLRPLLFPLLLTFLQNQNWRFQYVGLMAIGQVSEVLDLASLPLAEVLQFVGNPHPRLRFAALECIGQMAQDFAPEFQNQYHKLIPRLLPAVLDYGQPRVQRHAAGAVFAMVEPCTPEDKIVQKYASQIFQTMAPLLHQSEIFVKEQVVSTLGSVCCAAPEALVATYDSFMTAMKGLLQGSVSKEHSGLRGRVMECMAFVGMAAGRERFGRDAHDIMAFYVHLLEQGLAPDDLCVPYMMNSWPKICQVLEGEFVRYLPRVMPIVLQFANKQEQWETATLEGGLGTSEVRLQTKAMTATIGEKADACSILCSFAHELKAEFYPFLPDTLKAVRPLMQFYLNDEVRSYAISCMTELLEVVKQAQQRNLIQTAAVVAFYREILTAQLACLPKEPDHELLMNLVSSLEVTIQSGQDLGQALDHGAMMIVAEGLLKLLGTSFDRLKEREDVKHGDEDYDDETEATMQGENEDEGELNFVSAECVGSLMKITKQSFVPAFTAMMPHLEMWLSGPPAAAKIALFIIDDFVEHCSGPGAGDVLYSKLVPVLLNFTTHARPELRQAAAFGLGLCAEKGSPPSMAGFLPAIIPTLKAQATHPQARHEANACPTDNMISSLMKIGLYQHRPDLVQDWCLLLPLTADEGEAEVNHDKLCDLISQGVFQGGHLAHAAQCLVSLVCDCVKPLETPEGLKQKMVETLRFLRARPEVQRVLSTLPIPQQQQISTLLR